VLSLSGIGAARVPGDSSLCIPLLMNCSTPTPSPSPSSSSGSGGGIIGKIVGGATGGAITPDPSVPLVDPVFDPSAPVFTQPPAQLGGSSISFSGLKAVSVVAVRLANGTTIPCLKLQADDIVITGFSLNVQGVAGGPSLLSTAPRMELKGNVSVYVNSVTASLLDGTPLTLGAQTPPPSDQLPAQLLRVNLGLVGATAGSISYVQSHQHLYG
jgi:hypothetical protein